MNKVDSSLLKYGLIFSALLFYSSTGFSLVLVDSQDWADVYAGSQYAEENDKNVFFTRTGDATDVLEVLPTGTPITVVQSSDQAFVGNVETVLETRGYEVEELIELDDASTELYPENKDSYIVVERGSPSAAVVSASLSNNMDAWPLIVDQENIDEVESIIEDGDDVVMVGVFSRGTGDVVEEYATEEYVDSNDFSMSQSVGERIMEMNPDENRIYVTDGRVIESDIMTATSPVMLSGTNFPPEELQSFVRDHEGLESAIMIGSRLTNVGEDLKNEIEDNHDRDLSVFVKYGTARGDRDQVQDLNTFPMPVEDVELDIESADYDPGAERLFVTYSNTGSSSLFMLSTLTVEDEDGNDVGSGGDDGPTFIGSEESVTLEYDVDISVADAENGQVRFTTSYGRQSDNLDTYVTPEEEGIFGPPYTVPISIEEINDPSEVEIRDLAYMADVERFRLEVENMGEDEAYVSAVLSNVIVNGIEETVSARNTVSLDPGETENVYLSAELDRIDIEENEEVDVIIRYGENEGILINSQEEVMEFRTEGGLPIVGSFTDSSSSLVALLLLLGVLGGVFYFREDFFEKFSNIKTGSSSNNSSGGGYSFDG